MCACPCRQRERDRAVPLPSPKFRKNFPIPETLSLHSYTLSLKLGETLLLDSKNYDSKKITTEKYTRIETSKLRNIYICPSYNIYISFNNTKFCILTPLTELHTISVKRLHFIAANIKVNRRNYREIFMKPNVA